MNNTAFTIVGIIAHVFLIIAFLIREHRRPTATLAWLLLLIFAPVLGIIGYWFFGARRFRRTSKKSARVAERLAGAAPENVVDAATTEPRTRLLLRLCDRLATSKASAGNDAKLLIDGAATYRAIIRTITDAKDHVHLEFYIIQPDEVGRGIRDRLVKKAEQGVAVRVLYDAVGSHGLPGDFWRPLNDAGGRAAAFSPIRFLNRFRSRDRIDFRNHRKIVIVDAEVAFTGGINIGREYLGLNPEFGHWRDTHIAIRGPAASSFQRTFAADWMIAADEHLTGERYFPSGEKPPQGDSVVQVVDSGPDQRWMSIARIYVQAMAAAADRIWFSSPYFIPDFVVETALINAALRGVDVRILLPKKNDHRFVGFASRSYYREMLEAGIQIYEYKRGFLHAKALLIDRWLGTVGSANMDMRSFDLNFEINAFVMSGDFVDTLAEQFLHDLTHATPVTLEAVRRTSYPRRLAQATARLLSPLL